MHAPSRTMWSVLLTICLAIATAACGGGSSCPAPRTCAGDTRRVEDLPPLAATAAPAWEEPAAAASPTADPEVVEIHLDISSPMAGYLPPDGDGDLSAFQFVAQNAAQYMARVFGGADAPVRWVGVGHELRSLGARPQIERRIFDGRSTQLDRSMARILSDFRSGRAEAAAIVSDLMATGDVTGPLTLFGALGGWLESADVRTGVFHIGLFGLKADYWGVRVRGCAARAPLGCRFDELRRRWVALETVRQIPVYVLVLGRGAERVVSVMESLQATVDELNRGRALFGNEQQQNCCVRDDTVTLFCDVEGGFQPTAARATWIVAPATDGGATPPVTETGMGDGDGNDAGATAAPLAPTPPPAADARIDGTRLAFDFACSAVRGGPLAGVELELLLEATGTVANEDGVDWRNGWSTETGEVGRTLQLQGFVEAVRISPDLHRLETPALLHFPGR